MDNERNDVDRHLTEAELFALAAPAAGGPEELPRHLSRCPACSRALQEWKSEMRALADEDAGEIGRRSDEEWREKEDATIAALRRQGAPVRRPRPLRWAVAIAASLLLAALLLPTRRPAATAAARPTPVTAAAAPAGDGSELGAADQADDDLLRQASYLAAGGDLEGEGSLEGRL
jgi:hypothetical protein